MKGPEVVDVAFVPSRDTFLVLRSDLCIEFVKVQSRTNIHQVRTRCCQAEQPTTFSPVNATALLSRLLVC
jgi:hypothetical protein